MDMREDKVGDREVVRDDKECQDVGKLMKKNAQESDVDKAEDELSWSLG